MCREAIANKILNLTQIESIWHTKLNTLRTQDLPWPDQMPTVFRSITDHLNTFAALVVDDARASIHKDICQELGHSRPVQEGDLFQQLKSLWLCCCTAVRTCRLGRRSSGGCGKEGNRSWTIHLHSLALMVAEVDSMNSHSSAIYLRSIQVGQCYHLKVLASVIRIAEFWRISKDW